MTTSARQDLLDNLLHVIADAAFSWRLAPAGEASPAGLDVERADAQGIDCGRLLVGAFFLGGNAFYERAGQAPGIALLALGAAVDCQNSHFALLGSAAQCSAQSMCIRRLLLPKSAVIFQYGLWLLKAELAFELVDDIPQMEYWWQVGVAFVARLLLLAA